VRGSSARAFTRFGMRMRTFERAVAGPAGLAVRLSGRSARADILQVLGEPPAPLPTNLANWVLAGPPYQVPCRTPSRYHPPGPTCVQ
jgi:hypothetical protein